MNQATVTVPVGVSGGIRVQSRSHDEMDLEALYRTHYDDVYRYARARLACPDAAADVAQETFARAYQARAAGTRMANPRAWLLRTAMNLCVDHWRTGATSAGRRHCPTTWCPRSAPTRRRRSSGQRRPAACTPRWRSFRRRFARP